MTARKATWPERIQAVYDVAAEITDRELGTEVVNMIWTDELVREVRKRVVEKLGHAGLEAKARLTSNDLRLAHVHQWLGNPDKFSPFVDDTAIHRALAYDWSVIEHLTDTEQSMFYDALSLHPDPWQLGPVELRNGSAPIDPEHPRRMAFVNGPRKARDAVIEAVKNRRRGGALEAA